MSNVTSIQWTDRSSNPVYAINTENGRRGHMCVHASPGCEACYSETWNHWRGNGLAFRQQDLTKARFVLNEDEIRSWSRLRKPNRIFIGDMTDLFGPWVPDEWLDRIFAGMALAHRQTFQLLTKRADRLREWATRPGTDWKHEIFRQSGEIARSMGRTPDFNCVWPLPNCWLGVSCEDQRRADERIPDLLATPAAVRFISAEPLLGPITLRPGWIFSGFPDHIRRDGSAVGGKRNLHWVITGGESGPRARPAHPDWFRALRDQCVAAGVPYFFKQWGAWEIASFENGHYDSSMERNGAKWVHNDGLVDGPSSHREDGRQDTEAYAMIRVGKKRAGRLLDGREWNEMPEVRADG